MKHIVSDTQLTPVNVQSRRDLQLSSGDTVRVSQKIIEKGKTRIQVFEGTIIAVKHGTEPGSTFTVRRTGTDGITVEKIFPLYSPLIDKIEVVRRVKTRRAKLYFLRTKTRKKQKEKLRRADLVQESSVSEMTEAKKQEEAQKAEEERIAAEKEAQEKAEAEKQKEQEAQEAAEVKDESTAEAPAEAKETETVEEKAEINEAEAPAEEKQEETEEKKEQ